MGSALKTPKRTLTLTIGGFTLTELAAFLGATEQTETYHIVTLDKDHTSFDEAPGYRVTVRSDSPEGIALAVRQAQRGEDPIPFATKADGRGLIARIFGE